MMFSFPKLNNWSHLPMYKKICHYKLNLNANYSQYIDKIEAKRVVKDILGDEIKVANIIRILKDPTDFTKTDLSSKYLLKSAHASKWNVDLSKTDLNTALNMLSNWNQKYKLYNERQYNHVEPRFFIEEKIVDKFLGETGDAVVYMFRCIHGKPVKFSIKIYNMTNAFDIDKKLLKKQEHSNDIQHSIFLKMKNMAEKLAEPFEFVRIDFYLDKWDNIYFREFTFTPLAGDQYFSDEIELRLGKLWT